jgi:hypothetical protein
VASDHEPTHAALKQALFRRVGLLALGFAIVVAGGLLLEAAGYPENEDAATWVSGMIGVLGFALMGLALVSLVTLGLMRRYLSLNPWRTYECSYEEIRLGGTPNGIPTLVLDPHGPDPIPLLISSVVWRWRKLEPHDGGPIWFAGDPERRGVVAPPGGTHLLLVRSPRLAVTRARALSS